MWWQIYQVSSQSAKCKLFAVKIYFYSWKEKVCFFFNYLWKTSYRSVKFWTPFLSKIKLILLHVWISCTTIFAMSLSGYSNEYLTFSIPPQQGYVQRKHISVGFLFIPPKKKKLGYENDKSNVQCSRLKPSQTRNPWW